MTLTQMQTPAARFCSGHHRHRGPAGDMRVVTVKQLRPSARQRQFSIPTSIPSGSATSTGDGGSTESDTTFRAGLAKLIDHSPTPFERWKPLSATTLGSKAILV